LKNNTGDLDAIWSGLGLDKLKDMPDDIALLTLNTAGPDSGGDVS
jgi:hypothetical protein